MIRRLTLKTVITGIATLSLSTFTQAKQPIKVACIGDSITFGSTIADRSNNSYPAQLQRLLGAKYVVKNYGLSGHTMLRNGDHPWVNHPYFKQATDYQPNVVVIKLGTNDSKGKNWKFKAEFKPDTLALIHHFKSLPSKPRILLCTPVPALTGNSNNPNQIPGPVVAKQVVPLIHQAAAETGSELVDLYTEFTHFEGKLSAILPDKIHPKKQGAASIALRIADQIQHPRNSSYSIEKQLQAAGITAQKGNFHGYTSYNFKYPASDNANCIIVAPKTVIAGQPWIWRARFFGHQPALDQALLDRGYHVCYCDIAGLFGSPTAVNRWNNFHHLTQQLGLSKKPILEGMSRGGLIIFNWAKANPDKVAAIYGDNPVCDIRSWPAKKSPRDWAICLKAWNKTTQDMPNFKGNPIDSLQVLAKANIPVFLVLGTKDEVVPLSENAHVLAERYKKLNGQVTIWEKPNGKHHPHGLQPVFPLLRHLLHTSGNNISPRIYQRASTQTFPAVSSEVKEKRQQILKNSKRVLMLGDSITYAGDYVTDFITWTQAQSFSPASPAETIVNIGLPSETVSGLSEPNHANGRFPRPDLHERLQRALKAYKPDLIFACYGMNCGLQQPLDEQRFQAYKNGIIKLKKEAEEVGSKIIFVTPPYFDKHGKDMPADYTNVLRIYSAWLVSKRSEGWEVIDLNSEMTASIKAAQTLNPTFTVQKDRVHPNAAGHRMMAQGLINYYSDTTQPTSDLIKQRVINSNKRPAIRARMNQLKLAWLTSIGHKRPGIPAGKPLDQVLKKKAPLAK